MRNDCVGAGEAFAFTVSGRVYTGRVGVELDSVVARRRVEIEIYGNHTEGFDG